MSVTTERQQVQRWLREVDLLERAAARLAGHDPALVNDIRDFMRTQQAEPVRVSIAAEILGVTDKTVTSWVKQGLLVVATREPVVLLDAERLRVIQRLLTQLRAEGKEAGLLQALHARLEDTYWEQNEDFALGLAQMQRREGEFVR